ncbi:efflux RND transporter permease subunit [Pelagibacterium xiamenense]|uniref:efflux RND transporter permease subunit n=1 Tax=Pelagibacterium xiamenense TaxID=2901140 RepID=UPI001E3E7F58|nr:efflux RND transporter permease subunit [Pelagibacterium xiamenense]MCD7058998.1 efflux RND transporter permease subunit [Pelagibacterium xiamenense]
MRPSPEQSRGVLAAMVRHRNAANLFMLLFVLFGIWGINSLNRQLMPNTEVKSVNISVAWSGASAEDVEANILTLIEPVVSGLDGVTSMESYAREGGGTISLDFERTTDMADAERRVQTAVDGVNNLPQSAETPSISAPRFYDPVAAIGISGPFPEETLRRYAREIRDGLLDAGVDKVEFTGYRDRQLLIEVDDARLRQLGLTLTDLSDALEPNFSDQPSGSLSGDFDAQIRAAANELSVAEIESTEILSSANGDSLTFGDIATITDTYASDTPLGYMRGEPAIKLQISRSATADTVTTYETVRNYVDALQPRLPQSLNVVVFDAAAEQVNQRLALLISNGIAGFVLVLVVLFVFLDGRVAFWVAMGIPVAILGTLGAMYVMGLTIDMISMFALMMVLGIIVDDAIVVGEHTATLYREGASRAEAAIQAAQRMAAPVIASALTTMAAFAPIWLVGDVVGQIMSPLPIVVVAVLAASLMESFFILPGHLAHAMPRERKRPGPFRRRFDAGFNVFRDRIFGTLAQWSYTWRYLTAAIAIAITLGALGLIMSNQLRFEFFPTSEGESFNVSARFQAGTPQSEMAAIVHDIEAAVGAVERSLTPDGEQLIVTTYAGLDLDEGEADFNVYLTPSEERSVRTSVITQALEDNLPAVAGVENIGIREFRGGPPGRAVDVRFVGSDAATLKQASEELQDVLEGFPEVTGTFDTLFYGSPELVMNINDRGTALGFNLTTLGTQVRDAFEGRDVGTVITQDDEITVVLQRVSDVSGSQALRSMWVRTPEGTYVPLTSVVDFSERDGFRFIAREQGRTAVSVRADVDDSVDSGEILSRLESDYLPTIAAQYGISYELGGRQAEQNAAFADLGVGAIFAIAVMYIIIAWIFASYFTPIAVMAIIPFGLAGAVWGHYLLGHNLTIVSLMGMLGLGGILVNSSIVLIARMNERLAGGEGLREAALGAARDRLRAVILTSLTTIGGLTPLLFEKSLVAQFLIPMAVTIVSGLALATLLVLFLVPALLGIGADVGAFLRWVFLTPNAPTFKELVAGRHHDVPPQAPAE